MSEVRARYVVAVAFLTVGWVTAVAVLVLILVWMLFSSWPGATTNSGPSQEDFDRLMIWLAAVTAGSPVLIAAVAFAGRLTRTGIVFAVLAALLSVPAAVVAASAVRDLRPPPEPIPAPTRCIEFSGGDNRCPGG